MADLSQLGTLQQTAPLDLPIYRETMSRPFPEKGRYTARTRESFPAEAFGASRAGFLKASVDPTIVGGPHDGYTLRVNVSAKAWTNKDGASESQLGRYLKACGLNEVISGDPQEQANAVERTANTIIQIDTDWSASYNLPEGGRYEVKGMANFPKVDGKPSRFVTLDGQEGRPSVKDPITGEFVTIRAFLDVTRFVQVTQ